MERTPGAIGSYKNLAFEIMIGPSPSPITSMNYHYSTFRFLVFTILSLYPIQITAKRTIPCPSNPFLSPSTDICNALRYIPSNVLSAISVSLYILSALTMTFYMWKRGGRYMAPMVIGCYTMGLGLAMRFGLHAKPDDSGLYIVEYLFVVLSPCAFIAAVYVLLGRLTRHLGMDRYLLINPTRITLVFVSSDVSTFLIQAAGGAVSISGSTSGNASASKSGSNIFLAGLAIQLGSFFLFTVVYSVFLYRVHKYETGVWNMHRVAGVRWYRDWRALAFAMVISCVGILIRSAYRTVELSQGFQGMLARSEGFFYGLDTLPLFLAVGVYVFFWPGDFINERTDMKDRSSTAESDAADVEKNVTR